MLYCEALGIRRDPEEKKKVRKWTGCNTLVVLLNDDSMAIVATKLSKSVSIFSMHLLKRYEDYK